MENSMAEPTLGLVQNEESGIASLTPGERMQQARLALELSVDAVSSRLKISVQNLLALEADRYEKLPGETFVRGYIRAYAKLLGIDCDAALTCYKNYLQTLRDTTVQVTHGDSSQKTAMPIEKRRQIAVALTAVVIVVVLSVVFSLSDSGDLALGGRASLANGENPSPVELKASSDSGAGENAQLIDDTAIGQKTAVEVISDAREVKALASTTGETLPLATSSDDLMVLTFASECWVEIVDTRGDVLFTDMKRAGESLSLRGKAPFNVMLGDVRSASIVLNGKPVLISPNGNRKALRFQVGG